MHLLFWEYVSLIGGLYIFRVPTKTKKKTKKKGN